MSSFNFNIKKARIYKAVWLDNFLIVRLMVFFQKLLFWASAVCFFIFAVEVINGYFLQEGEQEILGFGIIFLAISGILFLKEKFFNLKLKKPVLVSDISSVVSSPANYNLAEFLNFNSAKAIGKSIKLSRSSEINSSALLYFIIEGNPNLRFVFNRLLLDLKDIKKQAKKQGEIGSALFIKIRGGVSFSDDFQKTILAGLETAKKKNKKIIGVGDLLFALSKTNPILKDVFIQNNLKEEDMSNAVLWLENIESSIDQGKRFWERENLVKIGTLAKKWTAGYTITLDKYASDITDSLRKKDIEFVGHKKEIKSMERILARREGNNVLIVGEPGTGRKSMIYDLSRRCLLGKSLEGVNYSRIMELDMAVLTGKLGSMEEIEGVLGIIFREAITAGNIILVINELHNYIGQIARPGVIDISGVLASFLRIPDFRLVGITTYDGLHNNIEKNPSFLAFFGKVEVSSISKEETLILLERLVFELEQKHKIFISYPAIREAINLTDRYMSSSPFPEKAISILDETAAYVSGLRKDGKERIVLPAIVEKIVAEKTEIPIGDMGAKEKNILLNLEDLMHKRIIGQEEAVREISTAMRRARSELSIRKGPMGSFLFLGPTGVGKTETAKALAEIYFGSEAKMITMDMSEFQEIKDIGRLIGSQAEQGLLTTPVRENPFSIVLLDEIEKAHPNILNLFLQVLDEGRLTDGIGRKIDFKETIVVATSNAGYEIILKALKDGSAWPALKQKMLNFLFDEKIFRPEFINRFDGVVLFKPLSKDNFSGITDLMLKKLKNGLAEKNIELVITEQLKDKIVELSYSPIFGARAMKRVIQEKVENILATAIISGKISKGSRVEINPENFELIIGS
jgi:ATP-dependent Clp protease ATP-binding subunit ClpC